jgi:hypothetical protein
MTATAIKLSLAGGSSGSAVLICCVYDSRGHDWTASCLTALAAEVRVLLTYFMGALEPPQVLGEESLRVATEKGDKDFEFDRVFGTKDGQEEVSECREHRRCSLSVSHIIKEINAVHTAVRWC